MDQPRYAIRTNRSREVFHFISEGPNGRILKRVIFEELTTNGYYNLSLGDVDESSGLMNYEIITNNGDRNKVLSTIVAICYSFFELYPNHKIVFTGLNKARTRLYQMAISHFIEELEIDFEIYGELNQKLERFKKNINYMSFIILKK